MYTVHPTARLAGVSVRTLHYYDQTGLLPPDAATPAGYRLYSENALRRLERILFLRELGFSLKEIGPLLTAETAHQREAVARHKQLLLMQKERLQGLIDRCERILNQNDENDEIDWEVFSMTAIEKARGEYADEAKQRWGGTAAYAQSETRTAAYGKKEWNEVNAEAETILRQAAALVGADPASAEAQAVARRWQSHITAHYYDCTDEILRGLAELYVSDERFRTYLDGFGPGTAEFLAAAIRGILPLNP